jgi:drug/metabolite transporter superfamily protein YnfA
MTAFSSTELKAAIAEDVALESLALVSGLIGAGGPAFGRVATAFGCVGVMVRFGGSWWLWFEKKAPRNHCGAVVVCTPEKLS